MRDEITVLKVEPGKPPELVSMANTLQAMQEMVGGYIEIVPLDNACLVCNDEGKLNGMEGNRRIGGDIIAGPFFIAGDSGDGQSLLSHDGAAGTLLTAVRPARDLPARRGGGYAPDRVLHDVRRPLWTRQS